MTPAEIKAYAIQLSEEFDAALDRAIDALCDELMSEGETAETIDAVRRVAPHRALSFKIDWMNGRLRAALNPDAPTVRLQ